MANIIGVKTQDQIVSLSSLVTKMWTDLTTGAAFTSILPAGTVNPPAVDTDGNVKFVVESTSLVNPLNSTQPYRIYVECVTNNRIKVAIANPIQIKNDGTVAAVPGLEAFRAATKSGMLGTKWDDASVPTDDFPTDTQFIVRTPAIYADGDLSSSPMSYQMTLTDHGLAFFAWNDDNEHNPRVSWFVVQSPVDKETGAPRLDKQSPIFCVYSCNSAPDGVATATQVSNWLARELVNYTKTIPTGQVLAAGFNTWLQGQLKPPIGGFTQTGGVQAQNAWGYVVDSVAIYKFVVNESDVFVPSPSVRADVDRTDSAAIINTQQQVAISTGNQYLVTIPNRLNTQRYAYTDELDLIGYTSADVISQDSDVPVTVYGESEPRVYKAMKASGANNVGFRILSLISVGDSNP